MEMKPLFNFSSYNMQVFIESLNHAKYPLGDLPLSQNDIENMPHISQKKSSKSGYYFDLKSTEKKTVKIKNVIYFFETSRLYEYSLKELSLLENSFYILDDLNHQNSKKLRLELEKLQIQPFDFFKIFKLPEIRNWELNILSAHDFKANNAVANTLLAMGINIKFRNDNQKKDDSSLLPINSYPLSFKHHLYIYQKKLT